MGHVYYSCILYPYLRSIVHYCTSHVQLQYFLVLVRDKTSQISIQSFIFEAQVSDNSATF